MMWLSTPQVIGLTKPSGGGGVNDELTFRSCETKDVGSFGIQLPITILPPGFVTRTNSLATSKGLGANMAPKTERVRSKEWLLIPSRLHASPSWNFSRWSPACAARLFPASTRFFAMSIPTTSAPRRARGSAVVPSQQPTSRIRIGVVIPRDFTSTSPDSRMNAAISVKSPFSHSALFGFITAPFDDVDSRPEDTSAVRNPETKCRPPQAWVSAWLLPSRGKTPTGAPPEIG